MMPPSTTTSETLPSSVFESLLPKLLSILQVTQRPEGTSNVRNKQDLLQAVSRARLIGTTLSYTRIDSSVSRSSQQRAFHRECASGWRDAYRGARRDHRHAREASSQEAVRIVVSYSPGIFIFFWLKRNFVRADFVMLQITVARLLGQGYRYQGRGLFRTRSICGCSWWWR